MVEMKTLTIAGVKYLIKDEAARDQIKTLRDQNNALNSDVNALEGQVQELKHNINNSVKSVNGQVGEIFLDAEDVNALPADTVIPSIDGLATEEYVDDKIANLDVKGSVTSVNGQTGAVQLEIPSIEGLASEEYVNNAINNLDVSGAVTSVNNKTGAVKLSAADVGATTESYVDNKVADLVNSAPDKLNTLNELAAALNNDENFANTVTSQISEKVPQTRTINNKALSSNITLSATDVKADPAGSAKTAESNAINYTNTVTENTIKLINQISEEPIMEFALYTDFKPIVDSYYGESGLESSSGKTVSQHLRIKGGCDYYIAYKKTTGYLGAFFNSFGTFIKSVPMNELIQYEYQVADGNANRIPRDKYVKLYKFTAPTDAHYFSLNLLSESDSDYYCQYICSKPIFALRNTGNHIIYEGDPFYQEKKNKNLCVIGASGVALDRMLASYEWEDAPDQYTVGFQEYLMPYYNKVDSYGFWSGSWAQLGDSPEKNELSIYTGLTQKDDNDEYILDLAQYDEFLLIPSTAEIEQGLGEITSTDITKYFGGVNGVIDRIIEQRTNQGLSPAIKIYVANTVHKGGYFSSLATQNSMDMLNSKITDFCSYHSYQLVDLVSGANLSKNTYMDFTWDGKHLNQEGSRAQGLCILKSILYGSSAKILDPAPETVEFCLYTQFDFIPGRWNSIQKGTISLGSKNYHSQLLRVNPDTDYYTGYIDSSKKIIGAFFTESGKWIKSIEIGSKLGHIFSDLASAARPGDVEEYIYDYPDMYPDTDTDYVKIYKFRAPAGAYYFSFNIMKGEDTSSEYIYRRYISSKPLFSHTDAGNHLVYKDSSPLYERKKSKKLCIIGDIDVQIDRTYYSDIGQYTIGFQEFLMRWYDKVKSCGFTNGYNTTGSGSVWRGIVKKGLDLSSYDDFLIMPAILDLGDTPIGEISDAPSTVDNENNTYFGCLSGVIEYIKEQRASKNLPTRFYIANVLRKGVYYSNSSKRTLMQDLNTKLEEYCNANNYELVNIQGGVGLNNTSDGPNFYQNFTRADDYSLLNQAGNERLGKYLIKRMVKDDNAVRATLIMEDRIGELEARIAALEALLSESSS